LPPWPSDPRLVSGWWSLLNRALETAEAAGATAFIPRILAALAHAAFQSGQVEEGQALLDRGRVLAQAAHDGETLLWHETAASEVLFRRGRFLDAAEAAVRGIEAARQAGLPRTGRSCAGGC
jgi:hypothetical protein